MTKNEFLKELCTELSGLSAADAKSSVEYYGEMIEERIDAGMSEEEACRDLGSPSQIAREIMMNLPMGKVVKSKLKRKRALKVSEIICLILGSPIWLSLLAAVICVVLSVYIVLWSVYVSLLATTVGTAVGGLGLSVASLFKLASTPENAVLCIGIGLSAIGIGAFCFLPCIKLGKCFVKASIKIWKGIKSLIIGKDKNNENGN